MNNQQNIKAHALFEEARKLYPFDDLADMVLDYLLPSPLDWRDATRVGAETLFRCQAADTPLGRYKSQYMGDGEFVATGPTIDGSVNVKSVADGVAWIELHWQELRAKYKLPDESVIAA